ncbi:NAD(P)/FAD-dependent oxidoreductase [Amycolatopsis sp. FDAARGOS 1241]|nr:NAD(P)/FAD-dependent oxidoreductase [Amycolatopsis sp. FDAARGOS 1241]
MGTGGEAAAYRLLAGGLRIAVIEKELIGGECAYWACIPSKTLLRSTEARAEAQHAAGLTRPGLDWAALPDYRDYMVRHLDDTGQADGLRKLGATVIKATARLAGPGRVEVEGRLLTTDHVIIGTGAAAKRLSIDGLTDVPVWTNRKTTTLTRIPERVAFIGGGAAGIELGHFLARMGTQVTIVHRGPRLLDREDPALGDLIAELLTADGIDVRTGVRAHTVHRRTGQHGEQIVVELDDGTSVSTDVIVNATGRTPNTASLNLAAVGVRPGPRGELPVDENCRAADGLWAIGDVTGVELFTHVATYQGRVVADNILGRPRVADYTAVPRVVFTQPEIAAVGLTPAQARGRGIDIAAATLHLADEIARPYTYETAPSGTFTLIADRRHRTLVGAWAVAPLAGEWINTAALAIRHHLTADDPADGIAAFPSYTEALTLAADKLSNQLQR